jgi:hypothetical protein
MAMSVITTSNSPVEKRSNPTTPFHLLEQKPQIFAYGAIVVDHQNLLTGRFGHELSGWHQACSVAARNA